MKKLISIAISIALVVTLFHLAGNKVKAEIENSTSRARAVATMTASQ